MKDIVDSEEPVEDQPDVVEARDDFEQGNQFEQQGEFEPDFEPEFEQEVQDEYEYQGEQEFVNEFGAFERSGYVRQFAETEEDIFLNNMEIYARLHTIGFNRSMNEFSTLLINYPHPRFLNPQACFDMKHFYDRRRNKYVWDNAKYDDQKGKSISSSSSILYRYIDLFNEFALK